MDEVLQQILIELKDIKTGQKKTNEKIDTIENKVDAIENKVGTIENKVNTIESDISIIKTQVKEHGQILSSLERASEFHKADIDNLTHQLAKLSGEIKSNHSELTAVVDSLVDMYS